MASKRRRLRAGKATLLAAALILGTGLSAVLGLSFLNAANLLGAACGVAVPRRSKSAGRVGARFSSRFAMTDPASLDARDTGFMERLRNLAHEALTWPHLGARQRLVWAAALEVEAVPMQELPPWFWKRRNITHRHPGLDLLTLDGSHAIGCFNGSVAFKEVRRFLRMAIWVYKAERCTVVTSRRRLPKKVTAWLQSSNAEHRVIGATLVKRLSAAAASSPTAEHGEVPPLRQCQLDCLDACAKGARVIEMACGTGKTRVIRELVTNISGKVLITVPLRALLDQFAPDFPGFCKVGTGHNNKIDFEAAGFIAVTDSVHFLQKMTFDSIFVDEAHHPLPAKMPKGNQMYRFSATHKDETDFRYAMCTAIEDGVLCDYDITVPALTAHHAYVCLTDLLLRQAGRFRRVLAYCNSVVEAKRFRMVLRELGLAAWHINGKTPLRKRENVISEFSGPLQKAAHVLVTVEVLGEGINIPNADTCMFVEPRSSYRSIIQAIGRVLRHDPGKTLAHIVLPAVVIPKSEAPRLPAEGASKGGMREASAKHGNLDFSQPGASGPTQLHRSLTVGQETGAEAKRRTCTESAVHNEIRCNASSLPLSSPCVNDSKVKWAANAIFHGQQDGRQLRNQDTFLNSGIASPKSKNNFEIPLALTDEVVQAVRVLTNHDSCSQHGTDIPGQTKPPHLAHKEGPSCLLPQYERDKGRKMDEGPDFSSSRKGTLFASKQRSRFSFQKSIGFTTSSLEFGSQLERFLTVLMQADPRLMDENARHRIQVADCTVADAGAYDTYSLKAEIYSQLSAILSQSDAWEARLQTLKSFVEEHAKLPLMRSNNYSERSLGIWLNNRGRDLRRGTLPAQQLQMLMASSALIRQRVEGWQTGDRDGRFRRKCQQLRAHFELHQNFPKKAAQDKATRSLAGWWGYLRRKVGLLSPAKRRMLDDVHPLVKNAVQRWQGTSLVLDRARWQQQFGKLCQFVLSEGRLPKRRSKTKHERSCHSWLQVQRQMLRSGRLPREMEMQLREVGPLVAASLDAAYAHRPNVASRVGTKAHFPVASSSVGPAPLPAKIQHHFGWATATNQVPG